MVSTTFTMPILMSLAQLHYVLLPRHQMGLKAIVQPAVVGKHQRQHRSRVVWSKQLIKRRSGFVTGPSLN